MRGTVQNLKRSFSFGRARRLKFPSKQTKIKRRAAGRHRSPGDLRKRGQHAPPLPGLPPAHPHPIPRVSHAAPSIGRAHASILASYQYGSTTPLSSPACCFSFTAASRPRRPPCSRSIVIFPTARARVQMLPESHHSFPCPAGRPACLLKSCS